MPREYLDQSTFPSARVRLLLRFDEFGATDTPDLPAKPPQLREGADEAALSVTPVDGRLVLDSQGGGGPQQQTSSNDGRSWPVDVAPKAITVERNGVRIADTCSVELKFADFPIDPRTVRSCAIQVWFGTLTEEQFRSRSENEVGPENVIPETWTDAQGRTRSNLRFQGWADDFKLSCPEDGEPTVSIECTDNTRLLIDQTAPPKLKIKGDVPIDKAVANYLAAFPQFVGLEVEYRPAGQPVPVLSKALMPTSGGQPTDGSTPPAKSQGVAVASGGKQSVWDYLTDCCSMVGCVVRVEGVRVVIQLPRTLYAQGFQGRPDDPFTGRILPSGRELRGRLLQYGQNVLSLEFSKKLIRGGPRNIEIRCLVGDSVLEARDIEHAYRRAYSGPLVCTYSKGARVLAGTPNHPVLTRRGWVALGEIVEGDDLVCCAFPERRGLADPNVDAPPTEASKLFDSIANAGSMERRPTRQVDFHGDGGESEVEVVETNRLLRHDGKPSHTEHQCKLFLETAGNTAGVLHGPSTRFARTDDLISGDSCSTSRVLGGPSNVGLFGATHSCETILASSRETSDRDPLPDEQPLDDLVGDTCQLCQAVSRGSLQVSVRKVDRIDRGNFHGHVFNLQTSSGWYTSSGVVTHNCYSPRLKKTLIARHPSKNEANKKLAPGEATDSTYIVFPVQGVEDEATLRQIAQSVYESANRGELEISASTHDFGSVGGGALDPDLLDLEAGDLVNVEMPDARGGPSPGGTEESSEKARAEKAEARLRELGFHAGFAAAYAKAAQQIFYASNFYTRSVTLGWNEDSGCEISMQFINYTEARVNKKLPEGEEPDPAASATAKASPVQVQGPPPTEL
jgi:hypothetical protein